MNERPSQQQPSPGRDHPDAPGYHLQFASDNTAGICPEALAAFNDAAGGFAVSYGDDAWTLQVCDRMRAVFETDADIYFVFNGTAANSTALATMCQSYQAVICTDAAHVATDECGAPEFFSNGAKLLCAPNAAGKLRSDDVRDLVTRRTDLHYPKARAVTLTQSTEVGTVYTVDEIAAVTAMARRHGLRVHMDGARFANAVVATGASPADLTWRAGVDVLCFGGTKMGLPIGEAVVFFDRELGAEYAYRCKQAGQLASKMRFLSAPWLAMLADGTWLAHAAHANAMARRLADGMVRTAGVKLAFEPQANGVFVDLAPAAAARLRDRGWIFYGFIGGCSRFMCSWSTTPGAVDHLLEDLRQVV